MSSNYTYYRYEGFPCRVAAGDAGEAEIYHPGIGYRPGPKMMILADGVAISKSEAEAMMLAIVRENKH